MASDSDQQQSAVERALLASRLVGVACTRDGRFVRVNEEFARLWGAASALALVGRPTTPLASGLAENASSGNAFVGTYECVVTHGGNERTLQVESIEVETMDGVCRYYIVVDAVARRPEAMTPEQARTWMLSAVNSMSDGFALYDAVDRIVLCNQVYAAMLFGFPTEVSMVGMHAEDVIRRQIDQGQPVPAEYAGNIEQWVTDRLDLHRRADGQPHVQEMRGGRWVQSIRHRTPDGGVVVLRSDITAFKDTERAAQMLAQHDPLTGLPNRRLLQDRVVFALARARRSSTGVAILAIDLDHFKPVNDQHGHQAGDEVLKVTAERFKSALRSADTVARVGGDEFIVLVDGVKRRQDVQEVALKLLHAASQPIRLQTVDDDVPPVTITCSIGISLSPQDGVDSDALVGVADEAMYAAKRRGRGGFAFAGDDDNEPARA